MMFVGANNKQMTSIDGIVKETLDAWHIVTLAGDRIISGRRVSNENCERIVKEEIKVATDEDKSVLIISNRIAQRSFSVPEITELYLAYDGGEEGSTIQKISRVLTSGDEEKVGHVFSLSFNPMRDDKFDSMVLETAVNLKNRSQDMEISDAIRSVLETFDIFDCTRSGAVKMTEDKYLGNALDRGSVSKALGKIVDLYKLSPHDLSVIASGIVDSGSMGSVSRVITRAGKVHGFSKEGSAKAGVIGDADEGPSGDEYEMTLSRARKVVMTVMENLDVLVLGTESKSLAEAIKKIRGDSDYQSCIKSEFGVTHETIIELLDREVINQDHADLMVDRCRSGDAISVESRLGT